MARAGKNHKGGRPKGTRSKRTLEREAVLAAYRLRAMGLADRLLNNQLTLANGQTFLFKIEKEKIIGPKGGVSYKPKRPVLVTSREEIQMYLEGEIDGDHDFTAPGATYYYLTTKEPDGSAIDSILDRTFGRSTQSVELTGKDGKPLFDENTKAKTKAAVRGFIARRNSR